MKKAILKSGLIVVSLLTFMSFDLPKDWFKAGSAPYNYEMGIDVGAGRDGKNAATIKSIKVDKKTKLFGTLMQSCLPGEYVGKRVRMTAYLKTNDVSDWAGLWFRVDEKESTNPLAFDNMHDGKIDRAVKGTTDWTKYEIVLDVSQNASNLAYGALLSGGGQIWFDNLTFEVVDNSVPTTGKEMISHNRQNPSPTNLDFEN
jgi:hypothetical protein